MSDKKQVYLDYAATTPVAEEVLDTMLPYFSNQFGNPSSIHCKGQEAKKALDNSRRKIAQLLHCETTEIIFTSGGTESDNLALKGVMEAAKKDGRNHLIISAIEHPAIEKTATLLSQQGFKVDHVPVTKEGLIKLDRLEKLINDKTALVSIIYANNEIGTIQSIPAITDLIKKKNPRTLFHTDAAQAFNYLNCQVDYLKVDLLSLSAQKIYGPKGVGLLYLRKGVNFVPQQTGGEQEMGKRAGTENIAGVVGMAKAMELADQRREQERLRLQTLRDRLAEGIRQNIDDNYLNGSLENRLCNNINFCFKGIEGEALVISLDVEGVMGSSGSACSSAKLEPSSTLLAIGRSPELAQGSLRLSLGKDTTEADIDYVLSVLPSVVNRLRSISPF
jgi:cysteine desulfurase